MFTLMSLSVILKIAGSSNFRDNDQNILGRRIFFVVLHGDNEFIFLFVKLLPEHLGKRCPI